MPKLTRVSLQELARTRVQDSTALLGAGRFSGAYHLVGLAVEAAIKACIARQTDQHEFPDLERARDSWQHKPDKLINTAGLQEELKKRIRGDAEFEANWLTVKDWDVDSRYVNWTEQAAKDLFSAVTDAAHGVLPWIEGYW